MPTPPQSQQPLAGSRFPAQSRQRQPIFLTPRRQSVGRGLRRDGCMGALGRPARSLPPWCQTNLVLPVSSAVSVRCNAACEMEAVQKLPISRLLPRPRRQAEPRAVLLISLAGRSRAAILLVLADMRSIAASGFLTLWDAPDGSWLSRQFAAVGMSESIPRNLCSGVRQRMERAENGESVTGAGGSVPILGVRHERKCRRGDAGKITGCRWHHPVLRPVVISVPAWLPPPWPSH